MVIFDFDFAMSKTDTVIFEIEIAYVSKLAHACLVLFPSTTPFLFLH
jgi:hypothetical protein